MNHCIFARVCEIISFNNCFWGVQKKRRKERRKEEISFRGTLWLFLGLLLPDSEQRFYMQKQNLLIQLSCTLSKHHGHLDSLWTHALQGYSTGMASKFTWMAIKVILGCQNHRKLRNCLLRLILGCVFLIWHSLYCCSSLRRHIAGKTFPLPVLTSKLDMVMRGCRSAEQQNLVLCQTILIFLQTRALCHLESC